MKLLTREEYDSWVKTIKTCTFCEWNKYQVVLKEFKYWVWIASIAPYWKYHTMIIPKRHFEKYSEINHKEAKELVKAINYGEDKILNSNLYRTDGSKIEKVVYFWRYRKNRYDPVSGNMRPSHFHLHLIPDRDHLWDPVVDPNAKDWDINLLT